MNIVEKITQRVLELPMLSVVASRLLTITGDDKHSLKDVVKIVENDSSLTTRILKTARSASYYRGKEVTTISQAILNLGEKMVVSLAMEACTSALFNNPLDGYESEAGELWDHSLRTAIASRELAYNTKNKVSPELAFTAGLLLDIGKAILSDYLIGDGNTETMTKWLDSGEVEDFIQAERELIGTDHTEVGIVIAEHWNLPPPICAAIKDHHYPGSSEEFYRDLVYVVHLGDIIAMLGGAGTGVDSLAYRADIQYENFITLTAKDVLSITWSLQEEFREIKKAITTEEGVMP